MVPKKQTNRIMDELYDLGARAILVSTHPRLPHLTRRAVNLSASEYQEKSWL